MGLNMANGNFYIFVDKGGKMPVLRHSRTAPAPSHPYFVRYSNNRPIAVNPYPGQTEVWDYSATRYIPVEAVPRG